jgi:hypothetical protein
MKKSELKQLIREVVEATTSKPDRYGRRPAIHNRPDISNLIKRINKKMYAINPNETGLRQKITLFIADELVNGGWKGEVGGVQEQMGDSSNNSDDPFYVEYVKDMPHEEPFMLGGEKFEYVQAKYPNGKIDLGIYAFAGDVVYGYNAFRKRYNIT